MTQRQTIEYFLGINGWMTYEELYKATRGYFRYDSLNLHLGAMESEGLINRRIIDDIARYSLNMERYERYTNALGGVRVRELPTKEHKAVYKPSNHDPKKRPGGTELAKLMLQTMDANHGVAPRVHAKPTYVCETCSNGSDGIAYEHPQTDACFVCGQDDWIDADCWHAGIRGDQYLAIMHRLK